MPRSNGTTHPDIIEVKTEKKELIEANRADFVFTIAGQSIISGGSALKKAREVADFVVVLREIGIEENRIRVEKIRVESHSGTFTKGSSAQYTLRIEEVPASQAAEVVGLIANARHASLEEIKWRFDVEVALKDRLRQECIELGLQQARDLAAALGVRLIGISDMEEMWSGTSEDSRYHQYNPSDAGQTFPFTMLPDHHGVAHVCHSESVRMEISFKFRVSEFGAE